MITESLRDDLWFRAPVEVVHQVAQVGEGDEGRLLEVEAFDSIRCGAGPGACHGVIERGWNGTETWCMTPHKVGFGRSLEGSVQRHVYVPDYLGRRQAPRPSGSPGPPSSPTTPPRRGGGPVDDAVGQPFERPCSDCVKVGCATGGVCTSCAVAYPVARAPPLDSQPRRPSGPVPVPQEKGRAATPAKRAYAEAWSTAQTCREDPAARRAKAREGQAR